MRIVVGADPWGVALKDAVKGDDKDQIEAKTNDLTELSGKLAERPGVLHSFNGNLETAQKALALNFYLGINRLCTGI